MCTVKNEIETDNWSHILVFVQQYCYNAAYQVLVFQEFCTLFIAQYISMSLAQALSQQNKSVHVREHRLNCHRLSDQHHNIHHVIMQNTKYTLACL